MPKHKKRENVFFSIIIPAYNEEGDIGETCRSITATFESAQIDDFEILVVNDNSSDNTEAILNDICRRSPYVRYINNQPPHGFGLAVKKGLDNFSGKAVCIVMADLSDSPHDMIDYYRKMKEGSDCVFGSRFIKGSKVTGYPVYKLFINRLANWFIKVLFRIEYNDITNAFKCYSREVINSIQPILSFHFNLTVELPLKAIVRGFNYDIIPISWTNRTTGISNLKLKEMGSRYLFIVLYVLLEKLLSKHDYYTSRKVKTIVK